MFGSYRASGSEPPATFRLPVPPPAIRVSYLVMNASPWLLGAPWLCIEAQKFCGVSAPPLGDVTAVGWSVVVVVTVVVVVVTW